MKIIIEELPVELVDRGWIKPLYNIVVDESEKRVENQKLEGLEAKAIIKLVKRILVRHR